MKRKVSEFRMPCGAFLITVFPTVYALRDALPPKSDNVAVHRSLTSGEICAAFMLFPQASPGKGLFGDMWIAKSTKLSHVIHESVHLADCYLNLRESLGCPSTFDVMTEKRAILVGEIVKIALKEKRA